MKFAGPVDRAHLAESVEVRQLGLRSVCIHAIAVREIDLDLFKGYLRRRRGDLQTARRYFPRIKLLPVRAVSVGLATQFVVDLGRVVLLPGPRIGKPQRCAFAGHNEGFAGSAVSPVLCALIVQTSFDPHETGTSVRHIDPQVTECGEVPMVSFGSQDNGVSIIRELAAK